MGQLGTVSQVVSQSIKIRSTPTLQSQTAMFTGDTVSAGDQMRGLCSYKIARDTQGRHVYNMDREWCYYGQ